VETLFAELKNQIGLTHRRFQAALFQPTPVFDNYAQTLGITAESLCTDGQDIPRHSAFSKGRHGRFQESKVFEQ
jgi:hypothetical protein